MDSQMIVGLATLVTALLTGLGVVTNSLITAYEKKQQLKKDEIVLLRDEVTRLHARNEELTQESDGLRYQYQRASAERMWFKQQLENAKLQPPPCPEELLPPKPTPPNGGAVISPTKGG